jgi:hypothetical protein
MEPPSVAGSPAWITNALSAISKLAELPAGWDGSASPPLQEAAKESAWRVLDALKRYEELPSPQVGPVVGGGLGIEWSHGARELDLEILPDGAVEYMKTELTTTGSIDHIDDGEIACPALGEQVQSLAMWLMRAV